MARPTPQRPGWYVAPEFHNTMMWWNGEEWVHEHTAPIPPKGLEVGDVALGVALGTLTAIGISYVGLELFGAAFLGL